MSKRKIVFRKVAQQDLAEAYDWYHSIDPGLAERLLLDLRIAADKVATRPLSCPVYLGSVRRTRLKTFPYYIYYRLERGSVVVHAILHTRRSSTLTRNRVQ
jgi:plasmid stabilization system protein ParE